MRTSSWLNIVLSIEKIFRDQFPSIPLYRFGLPADGAEQRALFDDKALFLNLTAGHHDRFQDTYCTAWLCEIVTPQRKYTPQANYRAVWLQHQMGRIQALLDTGNPDTAHFWPLHDYQSRLPASVYAAFLADGTTDGFDAAFATVPPILPETGFVVRAGSSLPEMVVTENPVYIEWTCVFQHWNPDAYHGLRG